MASFENIIRDYLLRKAAEDAVFGEKYRAKCSKDKDVVAGCCAYIQEEIKKDIPKSQRSGVVSLVIERDRVFGLAMHYIDEDIQEPKNAPKAKVETATTAELPKKVVSKPNPKPKAPKVDECQLSLF